MILAYGDIMYYVVISLFDGEKGVFLRSPKSMGESNP